MQTVFITNLNTGSVYAIAEHFRDRGWRVVVNAPDLKVPSGCEAAQVSLTDRQVLTTLFRSFGEDFYGVIHPAPVPQRGPIEEISGDDWQRATEEGPAAALIVNQAAGDILSRIGRGTILHLGSIHAEKPTGFAPLFSMACGAVQMLSKESALHYGRSHVNTFYLHRGVQEDDLPCKNKLSNVYCAPRERYAAKRLPGADSLNELVSFLFTKGAGPLNGADLRADSGFTMYYGEPLDEREYREAMERHLSAPTTVSTPLRDEPHYPIGAQAGRVALITGAGKGVGAGIARVLARAGMKVCLNYHTSEALAKETLEKITQSGGDAFLYKADVQNEEQVIAMVREVVSRYGGLDIVVNNAAMQYNLLVNEYEIDRFKKLWDINIGGYVRTLKVALPHLKKSECPRVINVSSVHSIRPAVFDAGYAMTKGAIRMFTREAALELGQWGITVNSINLGCCSIEGKTGNYLFHTTWAKGTNDNPMAPILDSIFPEDVGQLTLFLAAEGARQINGSSIRMDGGMLLV